MASQQGATPQWFLDGISAAQLFAYFPRPSIREELTAVVANLVNATIAKVVGSCSPLPGLGGGEADKPTSRVHDMQHQARQLYRRVLQHFLTTTFPTQEETVGSYRRKVVPQQQEVMRLLRAEDTHLSLLAVSLELLVSVAWGKDHAPLTIVPKLIGYDHHWLSIWNACCHFKSCFTSPEGPRLTEAMMGRLEAMMGCLEQHLGLAEGSHFFELVFVGGGGVCAVGNMHLVGSFIAAVGQRTVDHTCRVAAAIVQQWDEGEMRLGQVFNAAQFIDACAELVDNVMMSRLDLFFNVHTVVPEACCLYGLCKAIGTGTRFKDILRHTFTASPDLPSDTFSVIKPPSPAPSPCDVRGFYNDIFLPACDTFVRACASKVGKLRRSSSFGVASSGGLFSSSQMIASQTSDGSSAWLGEWDIDQPGQTSADHAPRHEPMDLDDPPPTSIPSTSNKPVAALQPLLSVHANVLASLQTSAAAAAATVKPDKPRSIKRQGRIATITVAPDAAAAAASENQPPSDMPASQTKPDTTSRSQKALGGGQRSLFARRDSTGSLLGVQLPVLSDAPTGPHRRLPR